MRGFARVLAAATAVTLTTSLLTGCLGRHGHFGASIDTYVYPSTVHVPQTVTLRDTRSNQVLWTHEIPPGRELHMKFHKNRNQDDALYPDMMAFGESNIGSGADMSNQIAVPPAAARVVETSTRASPEVTGT